MVGIIIGSGIFRTPTSIANLMGNPTAILALWAAGGALALCGALTYAELGVMFPRSGGIYVYLYEGLGPVVAFIFGWTYALITKPFAAAAIATVFSEHLLRLIGLSAAQLDPRILTCAMLIGLTALNVTGMRQGAGVAIVLTGLKFLALFGIVVAALALTRGDVANFTPAPVDGRLIFAIAPAFAQVLWTYDGWADVTSIAGEVREPARRMPRILVAGTLATTGLYLAVNAVYHWMIPLTEMRATDTVAPLVMERLLGPAGATLITVMVVVSTLGSSHGGIISGARVTFAQARDGLFFRSLGRIHPKHQTPAVSLWVQVVLSCVVVIGLQRFEQLTEGFVFTMWVFYAAAAAAVIVLRVRRPDLPRPYRCWGYPVTPVVFIVVSAGMTVLALWENPVEKLAWLGVLLAGVPAYYVWRRMAGTAPVVGSGAR